MKNLIIKSIHSLHIYRNNAPRWTSKAPRRSCYLSYQKEGSYRHIIGDKELTTHPGTVIFINSNDAYDVIAVSHGDSLCASLTIDNEPDSFILETANSKSFENLFKSLLLHSDTTIESNKYIALGILYEIFGKICEEREKNYLPSGSKKIAENAYKYIHAHYTDKSLDMQIIADACNTEVHKLNNLFKKSYKMTCWQYVILVRTEAANNMLTSTDYSIGVIADLCGFTDNTNDFALLTFDGFFEEACVCGYRIETSE